MPPATHSHFEPELESSFEPPPLGDLRPILYVLKVMGLLPAYSVTGVSEIRLATGSRKLYTRLGRALNFLSVCYIVYAVYAPDSHNVMLSHSDLDNLNTMVEVTLFIVGYSVIAVGCVLKSSHFVAIVNALLQLDAQLLSRASGAVEPLRSDCDFCWKYLVSIALLLAYNGTLTLVTVHQNLHHIPRGFLLVTSIYTLHNAVGLIFMVFVAALVQLLTVRFSYLNQLLSVYAAQPCGYHQQRSCVALLTVRSSEQGADRDAIALMSSFPADAAFSYRMHNQLLELYAAVNDYANHSLLAFLGYCVYTVTSTAYNVYLHLRSEDVFSWITLQWFLVWVGLHMAIVALLANHCDRVTKEANNTSLILARVYGKSKEYENIIDKYLTKSIKQDVQFTAYGFFVIDNSTLFKIFSAVTTYLVILIQFKQLEDSKVE